MNIGKGLIRVLCVAIVVSVASESQSQSTGDLTARDAKLTLVSDAFKFTEGPAVDSDGNVYFTDQPNDRILRWNESGLIETWLQPSGRSNGLFFDSQGMLLACADGNNELWRINPDKTHQVILGDYQGKRFNGPNDVWVSPKQDIYFTDPFYRRDYWSDQNRQPELPRQVYLLRPDATVAEVAADDFQQPNGIVGDPSRNFLYVADIGASKTYRFTINDDGTLSNRELFCEMGSDGMTVDRDGNVYLTGRGVTIFDTDGNQIQNIQVPRGWTANVCFGGPDRKTLFITASDSLFTIRMRTAGL
jgi:gluconolactonase